MDFASPPLPLLPFPPLALGVSAAGEAAAAGCFLGLEGGATKGHTHYI